MQYTVTFLTEAIEELKSQQLSWVTSRDKKEGEERVRVDKIIADNAVKIVSLEHDLAIIKASRGLNFKHVKSLVDKHYRDCHNLDENDNFIVEAN